MAKGIGFTVAVAAELTVVVLTIIICIAISSADHTLCNDAVGYCLDFTTGAIDRPTSICCDSVKDLRQSIVGSVTWQYACNCYPGIRNYSSDVHDDRVIALPGECGVSFPFELSIYTKCTSD